MAGAVIPVNGVRMSITPESRAAHTRCTAGQYRHCCTLSPPRFHQSAAYASRVFHRHTASPSAATGSRNPAPSPPGRSPASPDSAPARPGERRYRPSPGSQSGPDAKDGDFLSGILTLGILPK